MTSNQAKTIIACAAGGLSEDQKARVRFHLRSGNAISDICSMAASLEPAAPAAELEKASDAMLVGMRNMMGLSDVHGIHSDHTWLVYAAQRKADENGELRAILEDVTR